MKHSKKIIVGIVLLVIGAVGIIGLFSDTDDKISLAAGSIILIAVGVFLVFLDKKVKPVQAPAPVQTPAPEKESVPDGEMDYNLFEDVSHDAALCYEYEESLCLSDDAFNYITGNGGKSLTFKKEPNNPYDEKAVAVYLENEKIGYIYRGKIQDMFNDYAKRGWYVAGYLNKYSKAENKATYKIGFYKPLNVLTSKQFSLTKIKKKIDENTTREDNLSGCSEGDFLAIEHEDDCFVVFNDSYEEIGELPKSAGAFMSENEYKKIVSILEELDESDNEITNAEVRIYLVK